MVSKQKSDSGLRPGREKMIGSILIASRDEPIISAFAGRLKSIGFEGAVYRARTSGEIKSCLRVKGPDLLLLEYCFYRNAGHRRIFDLSRDYCSLRVACFEGHPYQDWEIAKLFESGADSYIDARKGGAYVNRALEKIIGGGRVVPEQLEDYDLNGDRIPVEKTELNSFDVEIILLTSQALDVAEIARTLDYKTQTIRNRRKEIYEKTDCHNPAGLIRYSLVNNIIDRKSFCGCQGGCSSKGGKL
jgi:DNA-binding NarL/FixJ family response regulator